MLLQVHNGEALLAIIFLVTLILVKLICVFISDTVDPHYLDFGYLE